MAGFFKNLMDNAGKATQSAIEKSKELAEITKLNMDSGAAEDSIKQAKQRIGEYVAENNLLSEVSEIHTLLETIRNQKARIVENNAKIAAIKAGGVAAEAVQEATKPDVEKDSSEESTSNDKV